MELNVRHDTPSREFSAEVQGHRAVLQYRLRDGVMTIVHTGVPDEIAGHGVAAELMRAALQAARENGWKVFPACEYAEVFMRRHPEYGDLLMQAPLPSGEGLE
ncbi:MAG: N-acetyltransferase [Proteobacteria bacterium]|nr:N-acetyltransferase [Pseudomonadota bacterium]